LKQDWFETFFRGVAVELWRLAIPPAITEAEVDFLVRLLGLETGSRVLDVPCGHGRHSIPLAKRGMKVTGLDLSEEALALARQDADDAGVAVDWVRQDYREAVTGTFDAAFCMGNSFGYLDREGASKFFTWMARAIVPGGRLAIDLSTAAESLLPSLQPRRWFRVGDILMLSSNRYVAEESRLDIDYTFVRGGVEELRQASSFVYTISEVLSLAQRAGWQLELLGSTQEGAAFELGKPALIVLRR
jgi:SAM-dependent methyltransferase